MLRGHASSTSLAVSAIYLLARALDDPPPKLKQPDLSHERTGGSPLKSSPALQPGTAAPSTCNKFTCHSIQTCHVGHSWFCLVARVISLSASSILLRSRYAVVMRSCSRQALKRMKRMRYGFLKKHCIRVQMSPRPKTGGKKNPPPPSSLSLLGRCG